MGDLSRLARITSWVRLFVWVIQHGICSTWNIDPFARFNVNISSGAGPNSSSLNEKRGGGSSPSCRSQRLRSIERAFSRHGVPVLKRPTSKPSSRKFWLRFETVSPILPPLWFCRPTCNRPRINVPVVTTTDSARICSPRFVSIPLTAPSLTKIRTTLPCKRSKFGWRSSTAFIRN
jgi:hypothetical protein